MSFNETQTNEAADWSQENAPTLEPDNNEGNSPASEWNDFRTVNKMPEKPQKVRRVGTKTLGFTLIAVGIVMICSLLIPNFPVDMVLRLSPIILILVGGEILYNAFTHREDKLRYDFLSMFVCFVLIAGSAGATFLAPTIRGMIVRDQLESRLAQDMEDAAYDVLKGEKISDLYVGCYLVEYPWIYGASDFDQNASYQELSNSIQYGSMDIILSENLETPEDFAATVQRILSKMEPLDLPFESVHISQRNYYFSIWVDSRWQWTATAEELKNYVEYSEEYRSSIGEEEYDLSIESAE